MQLLSDFNLRKWTTEFIIEIYCANVFPNDE